MAGGDGCEVASAMAEALATPPEEGDAPMAALGTDETLLLGMSASTCAEAEAVLTPRPTAVEVPMVAEVANYLAGVSFEGRADGRGED